MADQPINEGGEQGGVEASSFTAASAEAMTAPSETPIMTTADAGVEKTFGTGSFLNTENFASTNMWASMPAQAFAMKDAISPATWARSTGAITASARELATTA